MIWCVKMNTTAFVTPEVPNNSEYKKYKGYVFWGDSRPSNIFEYVIHLFSFKFDFGKITRVSHRVLKTLGAKCHATTKHKYNSDSLYTQTMILKTHVVVIPTALTEVYFMIRPRL